MWPSVALGGALGIILIWSAVLTAYDLRWRRLPDVLTLPAAGGAVIGALLVDPSILLTGMLWPVLYLVLGLSAGGVGGGDIKLALPLGIVVAASGEWRAVLAAVIVASVVTILVSLVSRRDSFAHGPGMLLGSCGAVVFL